MQVFICVRTQKIAFNAHTRIYANSIELSSRQICYASKQNAKYVAKFRVWSIMPKANSDLLYSRYCPFHCTVGKDTVIIFNNLLLGRLFLFIFNGKMVLSYYKTTECNHSIFRHDNFIGCFSADKIKMSVRKYFCFNIPIDKNMAEGLFCRSPYHEEYIQTSASGNPEDLCH